MVLPAGSVGRLPQYRAKSRRRERAALVCRDDGSPRRDAARDDAESSRAPSSRAGAAGVAIHRAGCSKNLRVEIAPVRIAGLDQRDLARPRYGLELLLARNGG